MFTRRVHKAGDVDVTAAAAEASTAKNVISEEEEPPDDGDATAAVAEAASAKKVIPATSLPTKYRELLAVAKKEVGSRLLRKTFAKAVEVAIVEHRKSKDLKKLSRRNQTLGTRSTPRGLKKNSKLKKRVRRRWDHAVKMNGDGNRDDGEGERRIQQ